MSLPVGALLEGTVKARGHGVKLGGIRKGKTGGGKTLWGPSPNPFKILTTWFDHEDQPVFARDNNSSVSKHDNAYYFTLVPIS